jgi:Zn-finger nucleic acid-binding protein
MTERSGVEIDYCPQCRGVWLDRGELDKIIERAGATVQAPPPPPSPAAYGERDRPSPSYGGERRGDQYGSGDGYRKKKRGFLDDIFDF